jgi:hypothetical protein
MIGNGHSGVTAVAALLARRWKENRPYFTLPGTTQDIALSSWWVRRRDDAGVEQHWFRVMPAPTWHRRVGTTRTPLLQRGI